MHNVDPYEMYMELYDGICTQSIGLCYITLGVLMLLPAWHIGFAQYEKGVIMQRTKTQFSMLQISTTINLQIFFI